MFPLDRRRKSRGILAVVTLIAVVYIYLQTQRSPFLTPSGIHVSGIDSICPHFEGPLFQINGAGSSQEVENNSSGILAVDGVAGFRASDSSLISLLLNLSSQNTEMRFDRSHQVLSSDSLRSRNLSRSRNFPYTKPHKLMPMTSLNPPTESSEQLSLLSRTGSVFTPGLSKLAAQSKFEPLENGNYHDTPAMSGIETTVDSDWSRKPNRTGIVFHFVIDVSSACDRETMILITVFSASENIHRRALLRNTWASFRHRRLKILFLIGLPKNRTQFLDESIQQESLTHGDLVQADFFDSYSNLSLKSLAMLQWTTSNCPHIRFLVKADDDVFLNTPLLFRDLQMTRHRRFVMGNVVAGARPVRDPTSKWFTPTSVYKRGFYPKYVSGASYVISGDVIRELYDAAVSSDVFWIEDVFVTGLLLGGNNTRGVSNVQHIYNGKFDINKEMDDPCRLQRHLLRHLVDPNDVVNLWSIINSKSECVT